MNHVLTSFNMVSFVTDAINSARCALPVHVLLYHRTKFIRMGLNSGDQFLVLAENDVVILKAITQPDMREYKNLIAKARKSAKDLGLTKESITSAIKAARKN